MTEEYLVDESRINHNLSVIGLGKLGLCMAGAFAEVGYRVIGVDVNETLIDMVNAGEIPYVEPKLDRVLLNAGGRLFATSDYHEAITNSDTTFIVVATPTLPDGTYSNIYLENALQSIAEVVRDKTEKHRIVVSCTVMPGTLEKMVIPLLEETSGKKLGEGFSLAYNPEFIAMGNVIGVFTSPDFVLVGETDPEIGETLKDIYSVLCRNNPPVARMNLINAELAKISLNCYVTTKITYANMLSELCELLPGADVDTVSQAIGLDERIGGKVLKGGIGFGGPCFPRDNRAFVHLAEELGMDAGLARQTHNSNVWQLERLKKMVITRVPENSTITVLGVAYRTDTPLIEESQAFQLARFLAENGYKVRIHDPVALENARLELGELVEYYDDVRDAIKDADAVVITMMDKMYKSLTAKDFAILLNPGGHVIDPWRLYKEQDSDAISYHPMGIGLKQPDTSKKKDSNIDSASDQYDNIIHKEMKINTHNERSGSRRIQTFKSNIPDYNS
ncbi:MAG: nucleotide sugar dehydrogenase [Candidatus Electryonea clarkiae]|nr:nucleotide sugar dehydrogenase [Candidatus Electryonea clarkiae]MDP8287538.1 nucleotide sugar dehydrogenase [Candidatus Electryonea clarkiae]